MTITFKNITLYFFLLVVHNLSAQNNTDGHKISLDIPKVALINIISSSGITLGNNSVVEAGQNLNSSESNNSVWINYSSIVGSETEPSRDIAIRISEGTIPEGVELYVKVDEDMGAGAGKMGKPVSRTQQLTSNPMNIISDIGSAYTGVGANKGNNVQYSVKLTKGLYNSPNWDDMQNNTVVINYTLSDN